MEQPLFEQMKDIPRVKPNPAQSMPAKPPNQCDKTRRVIGFILLAIFLANIALNITGVIIYNELPYLPGETAKITTTTSEQVFWGYFYSEGKGRIEYVEEPPTAFKNTEWVVTGRSLPGGKREFLVKKGNDWTMGYGLMNVNVQIPDVQLAETTTLHLRAVIRGSVARPINDHQYQYDRVEMKSVPFMLKVAPAKLGWFIHQDDFVLFSIIGIFFVFGLLLKKKK